MKHWTMGAMVLGVLLAAVVGCERERPPQERAEFDPAIDAQPTNLVVRPESSLMRDQARLAEETARLTAPSGKAGSRAGGAGATESAGVVAVREIVSKLIDAGKAGRFSEILQYVGDEDGQVLQGPVAAMGERAAAVAGFDKAVKDTLGLREPPASIQQALEKGPGGGPTLASIGDLATDVLSYRLDADNVIVSGGGTPLVFVKAGQDEWQIRLSSEDKAMYAALADLMKVQTQFVKTLTTDISEGAVTETNIDEKAMSLMAELVKPAMDRLKDAVEAAQKAAPAGGGPEADTGGDGSGT